MEVLLVEPGKEARMTEVSNDLRSLQSLVGGYIEATYPFDDPVALVCNDEGKIMQMPLNRALRGEDGKIYDAIAGPFFICGLGEDDFCSLPKSFRASTWISFVGPRSSSPSAAALSPCRTGRARPRISLRLRGNAGVSSCRRRLSSGH